MQLTIERADLLNSLSRLMGVIERRNTVPVVGNVLLRGVRGVLTLTATDLDIEVVDEVPAIIGMDGAITAPAGMLHDVVKNFKPGSDVSLSYGDGPASRLVVQCGRAKINLPVLPAGDFPTMGAVENGVCFSTLRSDLRRLLQKTRHAMSTEAVRHYLNGTYLHVIEEDGSDYLRTAATDGKVMARVDMPMPDGAKAMPGVIVPRKTCELLLKLTDGDAAQIEFKIAPLKLQVKIGKTVVTSKVIDGSFPDYGRVIPRGGGSTVVQVNGGDMLPALNTVAAMSLDKSAAVRFRFDAERLALSTRNQDGGAAEDEITTDATGDPVEVGFSSHFVRQVLGIAGDQAMIWHLFGAANAVRIEVTDDPDAVYVIMPLRV